MPSPKIEVGSERMVFDFDWSGLPESEMRQKLPGRDGDQA